MSLSLFLYAFDLRHAPPTPNVVLNPALAMSGGPIVATLAEHGLNNARDRLNLQFCRQRVSLGPRQDSVTRGGPWQGCLVLSPPHVKVSTRGRQSVKPSEKDLAKSFQCTAEKLLVYASN